MLITTKTSLNVEEFERLAQLPENAGRQLEYVGGRLIEVVSNSLSSAIAATILIEIGLHIRDKDLGYVTGADGGYRVAGERYIPDVAFISKAHQPKPSRDAYNPNPPDLAVEVLSPSNNAADMRIKVVNYLRVGATVWVVDSETRAIEVYAPDKPPQTFGMDDSLDGGAVLPGLVLPVRRIFASLGND